MPNTGLRQPHPRRTTPLPRPHRRLVRTTHQQQHHHRQHSMEAVPRRHTRPRPTHLPDSIPQHLHTPRHDRRQDHSRSTPTRPRARPNQRTRRVPTMQRAQGTHDRPRAGTTTPLTPKGDGWQVLGGAWPGRRIALHKKLRTLPQVFGSPAKIPAERAFWARFGALAN